MQVEDWESKYCILITDQLELCSSTTDYGLLNFMSVYLSVCLSVCLFTVSSGSKRRQLWLSFFLPVELLKMAL